LSSGNVGIGTTTPWGRLGITGSGATSATNALVVANSNNVAKLAVNDAGSVVIGNGGVVSANYGDLEVFDSTGDGYAILSAHDGTVRGFIGARSSTGVMIGGSTADTVYFYSNNSQRLSIDSTGNFNFNSGQVYIKQSSGNVGIGTTSPLYKLAIENTSEGDTLQVYDTDGNCRMDPDAGGLTTTCSSDINLKTDITESQPVLPYLQNMQIKDFTVIASGDRRTGVIAQELLSTHPELVKMGEDGYYGVTEVSSWKLIKAIQELNIKIDNLQTTNTNQANTTETSSLFEQLLTWVGDKVIAAKEFVGEKITVKEVVTESFEMKDSDTGQTWCVKIKNGEWDKVQGNCDSSSAETEASSVPETPPETEEQPVVSEQPTTEQSTVEQPTEEQTQP
jgi:hypothetical protein